MRASSMPPRSSFGIALAFGALASALAFFAGVLLDVHALRLATKPWPVVLLALWVWRRAPAGAYRKWMVAGLGASLAGDMFLEASPRGLFIPGLLSFLVAHVFYVLAYLSDTRALAPLRALPAYAFGLTLVALLWAGLPGPLSVPVAIYALVICTMVWRAAARVGHGPAESARLALAGALVFTASDSLIAIGRFGAHLVDEAARTSSAWRLAIMITYWGGQWLIASSAITRATPQGDAVFAAA
jgi:uncharacterized membrane protein YhhN